MVINTLDLHKKSDEASKYFKQLAEWEKDKKKEEPDPRIFIEDEELIEPFKKRQEEILIALPKYQRVYLVVCEDLNYSGIFHSVSRKQVEKTVNKAKSGFQQNSGVCNLMACNHDGASTNTKLELTQIEAEKTDIPPGIVVSIGNILLNKEGIGIAEAGK